MARILPYFSFKGRVNRRRYWETALALGMLFLVGGGLSFGLIGLPAVGAIGWILLLAAFVAFYLAGLANGARRLHDRGMSAWWLTLFWIFPTLLNTLAKLIEVDPNPEVSAAGGLLSLIGLPFSLWGLVAMGFLKGTAGPNKYGDDPLEPRLEVAVA